MEDLIRRHYQLQSGRFVTEARQGERSILVYSKLSTIPMWNHLAWLRGSPEEFAGALTEARGELEALERCPVVYLPFSPAGGDPFHSVLTDPGYEPFDKETWMAHEGRAPAIDASGELCVRRVDGENELQDFIDVFYASYRVKDPAYGPAIRRQLQAAGPVAAHHFVGRVNGCPVCIATVCEQEGEACIYDVGTAPEARQRGYARALLGHVLWFSAGRGHRRLFLQVESGSAAERLYQQLGFRSVLTRTGYRVADWAPMTGQSGRASAGAWISFLRLRGEVEAEQPERVSVPLDSEVRSRLLAIAEERGWPRERLFAAAWANLLTRIEGDETARFRIANASGEEARTVVAAVPATGKVTEWLERFEWREAPGLERPETTLIFCDSVENETARVGGGLQVGVGRDFDVLIARDRAGRMEKSALCRLLSCYAGLLESLAVGIHGEMGGLRMLSRAEEEVLVQAGIGPDVDLRSQRLLPELFDEQVRRSPDEVAVVVAEGAKRDRTEPGNRLTFRELDRRAGELAAELCALGAGSGMRVGLCLERSADWIVGFLGVWRTGASAVPLDPSNPGERLAFIASDSSVSVLVTHRKALSGLGPMRVKAICLDEEERRAQSERCGHAMTAAPSPEDEAYVIYTSGSTGKPKGVAVTHGALAAHCRDMGSEYRLGRGDAVLQFAPFSFDAGLEQAFPALITGCRLVVRGAQVWTAAEFFEALVRHGLTVVDLPPGYLHQVLQMWVEEPARAAGHRLRLMIAGGEPLLPKTVALWHRAPLRGTRLINAYGPTETVITSTTFEVPDGEANGEGGSQWSRIPIGRPRAGRRAYVLDRFGRPAPPGVPGELWIGGPVLARGYVNRTELEREKFVPDPFAAGENVRMYGTGDRVVRLPDGNLDFLGRLDDQVKIRGFRVELGEIEALLNGHPGVRHAAVAAWGDGAEKRLGAYCVAKPGSRLTPAELRGYLLRRLPEYMVPSSFSLVPELPLLSSGKVDRRSLPAPSDESAAVEGGAVKGPSDPLELQLQLAFEKVLRRRPIGVDESFFALGGDSMQALELILEIGRATGLEIPLGTLYQASTIEELARMLRRLDGHSEPSCLVPLQVRGSRPPLFLVHTTPGDILGYGNLVYHFGADQPCYGFQSLGLCRAGMAHTRIEEMAAHYIALLRSVQPAGPYYLGGWCYGGIVAVEMARQLLAAGEQVRFLGLMETVALPPSFANRRYYLHRLRCLLRMRPKGWGAYFRGKLRYHREAKEANRMRFRPAAPGARDPRLVQLEAVYRTNMEALRRYRSTPYPGRVTLFNASEADPAVIVDPENGWRGLAGEIETHFVPGNHDTMLTEPHVAVLARQLIDALRAAQRDFGFQI